MGIVVCVASAMTAAAADYVLTAGAFTDDYTIERGDDCVAGYSSEGPRLADTDSDHLDEMKPNVMSRDRPGAEP